jgi:hypothetical protein
MTASVVKLEPLKNLATKAYAYDNPRLDARGFLLATMHSPNVSLRLRIKAAFELMKLEQANPEPRVFFHDEEPAFKYVIGGIPSK